MKVILDTDGTLTDFNKFIKDNAIKYFEKKYDMHVIYPNKLEIEEIFDIKNVLINERNYTIEEAEIEMKKMLNQFWISLRFVKFSLFTRFRPGVTGVINGLIKQGHEIEVHTSRAKTCNDDIIGKIARNFTIWQYRMNGILLSKDKFHFYPSDNDKIEGIISASPQIVFEDKKEIIDALNQADIHTICVNGNHNTEVVESNLNEKVSTFEKEDISMRMKKLLGKKEFECYNREAKSDMFYHKISKLRPFVLSKFNPIVLNEQNIKHVSNEGIIYAPNHRSTLDPLVITGYLNQNIHWAALLRFFEGKDSIFNNSKNPVLCKITSKTFKKMEYFPIDRKSDNPDANNFDSIKDMCNFLKINSKIGIFAEGTTRRPEGKEFGTFDDAFLSLAKRYDSWIQPITTLWVKELGIDAKLIINFGQAFKVNNMSIEQAMQHFMSIQWKLLEENKQKQTEIVKQYVKSRKNL